MEKLKGYKTHLVAVVAGVATMVHYMGWMDAEAYQAVLGILGPAGVMAFRSAMKG